MVRATWWWFSAFPGTSKIDLLTYRSNKQGHNTWPETDSEWLDYFKFCRQRQWSSLSEDKLETNKLFFGSVAIHNNKCICSLFAGVQQQPFHDKSSQSDALGSLCFVQFVCFALYFQAVKNKSVFFSLTARGQRSNKSKLHIAHMQKKTDESGLSQREGLPHCVEQNEANSAWERQRGIHTFTSPYIDDVCRRNWASRLAEPQNKRTGVVWALSILQI